MSKDYEEAIRMVGDLNIGIIQLKTTLKKNCHSALLSFMKTLFFVLCSTPPPCCRAARMCVWAVPSLVRGATLLPLLLLPPRRVWRIAAGWWVGAGQPLRLTHQPTRKISLPEIYMCAPTKDGSLTRPSLKHNTHIFTQSTVSHNGMSRCIPQKFLFSACVGMRSAMFCGNGLFIDSGMRCACKTHTRFLR